MKLGLIIIGVVGILLIGCSTINQDQAEGNVKDFIKKNVKFYTTEDELRKDLPVTKIDSITSYQKDKEWIVIVKILADFKNETKKNDLIFKLNRKGDIVEFNGQKVEQDKISK